MLSKREWQMLAILRTGASNKEIAYNLKLSENTIEKYLTNLYRKLDVNGRVEAFAWYENMIRRERVGRRQDEDGWRALILNLQYGTPYIACWPFAD